MPESGTHARVESLADAFDRVLSKLDQIAGDVVELRVDMAGLKADVANVRALVDGVHSRADKLEAKVENLTERIVAVESAAPPEPPSKLATAGYATAGGGIAAAIAEAIARLVGS